MQLNNVERLLLFRKDDPNRPVYTLEQLQEKYTTIRPDGTNFYYGINPQNVSDASGLPSALNPTHRAFLNSFLSSLVASEKDEKTLVLGVDPPDQDKPYAFVASNLNLVKKLATDLNDYQQQARAKNKRFNVIIRYASEMNDGGQTQGHDPAAYRSTFVQVRQIFAGQAPQILFSFSPALRYDLPEELIAQYWPGDHHVDVIGGTWYVGSAENHAQSLAHMTAYFRHRIGTGKPFGISELGGCTANDRGNDQALQVMLHDVEALSLRGIHFLYITIFLECKWGSDATLKFLQYPRPSAGAAPA